MDFIRSRSDERYRLTCVARPTRTRPRAAPPRRAARTLPIGVCMAGVTGIMVWIAKLLDLHRGEPHEVAHPRRRAPAARCQHLPGGRERPSRRYVGSHTAGKLPGNPRRLAQVR